MNSSIEISKMNLESLIPTGFWTLYFHSPEETKWTLNTFINLGAIKTWKDFWSIINALNESVLSDGMFFMMHGLSPPLWESHQNIRGGCYAFRCQKKDAPDIYINHIIAAMIGTLSGYENHITGVSISPKRGFNIVKLWNTNAQKFNQPSNINTTFSTIRASDIMYTPFVQKKM